MVEFTQSVKAKPEFTVYRANGRFTQSVKAKPEFTVYCNNGRIYSVNQGQASLQYIVSVVEFTQSV